MNIEFGNHSVSSTLEPLDDRPRLTTFHVPEADAKGQGGYSHKTGKIDVQDFKAHMGDAVAYNGGITHLPDHEILVSLLHPTDGGWLKHSDSRPKWVKVHDHQDGLTPKGRAADIEQFLTAYFECPSADEFFGTTDPDEQLVKKELGYWTRSEPGVLPVGVSLPPAKALYLNDGRVMSNNNDGGGQVGATGVGTAATATSATSASTWTTNQWAGYRIVVTNAAGASVWGNVVSNTNAAGASIATVDRWYNFATPGGLPGTTPASGWYWAILDGGMTSAWFAALATGGVAPAVADHAMSTGGNVEIVTAGGGLIRRISPYAQTSGVAARALTLTPVWTANGTDALPAVCTNVAFFTSMVPGYAGAGGPMKFHDALAPSATMSAVGDQLTITETVSGS